MKYLKIIILIMICAVMTNSQSLFKLNYNISFANSHMKEFIDKTSFSGMTFDYGRYFSRGNYSIGMSFGWNYFSEQYFGTTEFTTETGSISGAVTGNQLKHINVFPVLVTGTYYFKPHEHSIIPFVNLGVGTYYIDQRFQIGIWELESNNWHFGVAPEAGILFKLGNKIGLNTSARLNYAFDSDVSVTGNEENDYSFWTISIGLTFVQ